MSVRCNNILPCPRSSHLRLPREGSAPAAHRARIHRAHPTAEARMSPAFTGALIPRRSRPDSEARSARCQGAAAAASRACASAPRPRREGPLLRSVVGTAARALAALRRSALGLPCLSARLGPTPALPPRPPQHAPASPRHRHVLQRGHRDRRLLRRGSLCMRVHLRFPALILLPFRELTQMPWPGSWMPPRASARALCS